jgi:hypothetical protein
MSVVHAGVSVPEVAEVAGHALPLRGAGPRRMLGVAIYVGALYVADAVDDVVRADVPKRLWMSYRYGVGRRGLVRSFRDKAMRAGIAGSEAGVDAFCEALIAVRSGEAIVLDHVPGEGVHLLVGGRALGCFAGVPVMQALWSVLLGERPATPALKRALLGSPQAQ